MFDHTSIAVMIFPKSSRTCQSIRLFRISSYPSIYHVNRPVKHCQENHCYRFTSGQKPTKTAGLTNGLVSGTLCIISHGCVDGAMWVVHRSREPAAGVSRCECSPQSPARAGFRKAGPKPAAYGNPADPVTMVRRLTRAPLSGRFLRQTGWYREY